MQNISKQSLLGEREYENSSEKNRSKELMEAILKRNYDVVPMLSKGVLIEVLWLAHEILRLAWPLNKCC